MKHLFYAALAAALLATPLFACDDDENTDGDNSPDAAVVADSGIETPDAAQEPADASEPEPADASETADASESADASEHVGEADASESKCTSDSDCPNGDCKTEDCPITSCKTSSGECIWENAQCAAHSHCGDTQFCDLSGLTGESIFGVCRTGERPENSLACGEESATEDGSDCESGMAIEGADAKSYCTCECETADTCPAALPSCNDWIGMCIYRQNQ